MKRLLERLPALLALGLIGTGLTACGSSTGHPSSTSSTTSTTAPAAATASTGSAAIGDKDNDQVGDSDNDNNHDNDNDASTDYKVSEENRYVDKDDAAVLRYGRAATGAERREVSTTVKRFYAALGAGDGARACSLIMSDLANSVVEDYGRPPGPAALRGLKSCGAIVLKLFQQESGGSGQQRGGSGARPPGVVVSEVRTRGANALVVLRFGGILVPRQIAVGRQGREWRIEGLSDAAFP